ncbi:Uma2 family endonuclease [Streptomyces sp. NBC_00341]|uniref:Uma2 family endonuclease n=1 Tax=Streptomyces sp. NBC_00341 TaxID=2975717 RepID=UPI003089D75D|nr:Uma2 family endonuclease [Streptomyces sp. NBC_00341]
MALTGWFRGGLWRKSLYGTLSSREQAWRRWTLTAAQTGCRWKSSADVRDPWRIDNAERDVVVVPKELAKGGGALLPDQTFLVVEVKSESNAETDRIVKRRRYAEYRAPLYLLVDRIEGSITLFSEPGHLGYTRVDGPHPFGAVLRLPDPFGQHLEQQLGGRGTSERKPALRGCLIW